MKEVNELGTNKKENPHMLILDERPCGHELSRAYFTTGSAMLQDAGKR